MLGLTAYKTDGRLVQVLTIQNSCIDSNHDMSSENSPSPPFPPVRRVVTGHTVEGKYIVVQDAPVLPHPYCARRRVYFTDLFWTEEFPSENDVEFKDQAKEHETDHFSPNGSNFRLSEFPPDGTPSVSSFLSFIARKAKRSHIPASATLHSLSIGQSRLTMASYCRDQ